MCAEYDTRITRKRQHIEAVTGYILPFDAIIQCRQMRQEKFSQFGFGSSNRRYRHQLLR